MSEGSGPSGPGPSASSETEAARRELYRPGGGTAAAVAAFERLRPEDPSSTSVAEPPREAPAARRPDQQPLRRHRVRIAVTGTVVVCAGLAAVLLGSAQREPSPRVPIPRLAGQTIAAYGRAHDPAVGPASITYQPEGYTVFQAGWRVVHVAFRCRGTGTVRLAAGSVDVFHCTDRETEFVRSDGKPRIEPFMVTASTKGDVVWSVRVTLQDH